MKPEYVKSHYSQRDERGVYGTDNLTGPGLSQGESGQVWRDYDPSTIGRCWSVPLKGKYGHWIEENIIPGYTSLASVLARLDALDQADMLIYARNSKVPRLKRYLNANSGQIPSDNWYDIPPVNSQAKERIGYPTQKPLVLLERIIKASSNEGDTVLDPFCGCATACVAADRLGRKWIGIDISPKASELVNMRLQQAMGSLFHHGYVTARDDIPKRTDIDAPVPYRQNKHVLFGQQEGLCNGCGGDVPLPQLHRRSRGASEQRRDGPLGQPAAALRGLQLRQRRPTPGAPDSAAQGDGDMSDDMAEKKPRGRPMKKGYPPRIDATPEEIARAVLNSGRPKARVKSRTYRCGACGRAVPLPRDTVQRRTMPRMPRCGPSLT